MSVHELLLTERYIITCIHVPQLKNTCMQLADSEITFCHDCHTESVHRAVNTKIVKTKVVSPYPPAASQFMTDIWNMEGTDLKGHYH